MLEGGELLSLTTHSSLLVGGDFNAHHPTLQSVSPTNQTGHHLAALLGDIPHAHLLNTGDATHVRGGRLDLTIVSSDLLPGATWGIHPTLTSDHYATLTTLPVAPPAPPAPMPRYGTSGERTGQRFKPRWRNGGLPTSPHRTFTSRRET